MNGPGNPPPYNPGYPHPQAQPQMVPMGYPQPPNTHPGYAHPGNIPMVTNPAPVVVQTVPTYHVQVGQKSTRMTCPSCNSSINTRLESKTSTQAHIWALVLCIIGCWPCCLIPYCVSSCQDADHYCPSCNTYLGGYKC